MKFDYKFKIGDNVIYSGTMDMFNGKIGTIAARIGRYSQPAYKVNFGEDSLLCFENSLTITTEVKAEEPKEKTPEEIAEEQRVKEEQRQETNKKMLSDFYTSVKKSVPTLAKYSRFLNECANNNTIYNAYGREKEINNLLITMSRRTKSNSILVGNAGCGKTAIVEQLAITINNNAKTFIDENNTLDDVLKMPLIFDLSLNSLTGGTRYRGDFEERLDFLVKDIANSKYDIILFIDEIHMLVGCGNGGHESSSAGADEILKPYLARGELKVIGATTNEEYEKYIKPQKALCRRFVPIKIDILSGEAAENITESILKDYSEYYSINADVNTKALCNAQNILTNSCFPDNVIDVIDLTLAKAKVNGKDNINNADISDTIYELYKVIWIAE